MHDMTTIDDIKIMLENSQSQQVIDAVEQLVHSGASKQTLAQAYYLRGNAYRQRGDMRQAMNNYLEAMDLEPGGPAAQAYRTIQEILAFYNKDLYNP